MYEQGPIRPPSEASSLLVRVTRNCPWNRCLFCPAYKGVTFSRRTVEEVKRDVDAMAREFRPYKERVTSAFLQDANSLMIATGDLLEIIRHIKERFPGISRICTYARAKAMARKGYNEYRELKEAGLTRIHTGMESGSAAVLKMVQKGSRPGDIVDGGLKVMEAGISLSEYIMPGLGGKTLGEEHARETARLLNIIVPDFIRVRTFAMHPMSPMKKMVEEGAFVPMSDDEIVAEIRLLVSELKEMHSHFRCGDFSLNLLMQVDGYLDSHRDAMLGELDRFLALTKIQRQAYSLLRRSHPAMQYPIEVVQEKNMLSGISQQIAELEKRDEGMFHEYIQQLMTYQLPQPQTDTWT